MSARWHLTAVRLTIRDAHGPAAASVAGRVRVFVLSEKIHTLLKYFSTTAYYFLLSYMLYHFQL
jgi:hypothetical protein